jgi:hypothetical protein
LGVDQPEFGTRRVDADFLHVLTTKRDAVTASGCERQRHHDDLLARHGAQLLRLPGTSNNKSPIARIGSTGSMRSSADTACTVIPPEGWRSQSPLWRLPHELPRWE